MIVGGLWYYKSHYLDVALYHPPSAGISPSAPESVNFNTPALQSSTPPNVVAYTTHELSVERDPTSGTLGPQDWQSCRDYYLGYSIKYPLDWGVMTYGGGANISANCSDPRVASNLSFGPINSDSIAQPAINIEEEGTSTSLAQFFHDNSIYAISNPSSTPIIIAGESVPWFDFDRQESTICVWHEGHVLMISISHMPTSTLAEMLGSFVFAH